MSDSQKQKVQTICPGCKTSRTVCLGRLQCIQAKGGNINCRDCASSKRRGFKMSASSRAKMSASKKQLVSEGWLPAFASKYKGGHSTPPKECLHCHQLFHRKNGVKRAKFCSRQCDNRYRVEKGTHHFWKGGITDINFAVRTMAENKAWKQAIIERDGFNCDICPARSYPGNFVLMHVDHIKPLSLILGENKIVTVEDARACEELWDVTNGRILCATCHKSGATWAGRVHSLTQITA